MKYKVIKQTPYCCVPACMQMILHRRGLKDLAQSDIGYALGLSVPEEFLHLYPNARKQRPSSGYGTEVQNPSYSINSFFEKEGLPLHEQYFYIDDFADYITFIRKHLNSGADIIACFNNQALYEKGNWGHVSLLEDIGQDDIITLVDPDPDEPDRRKVQIAQLMKAIEYHGRDNRAGFWVINNR